MIIFFAKLVKNMKRLKRQISTTAIVVMLFAALAASLLLLAYLGPQQIEIVKPDPIWLSGPQAVEKTEAAPESPLVPLALALLTVLFIPVSFSFAIEKMSRHSLKNGGSA